MDKKDIALTVGGVIATMVLAWLLYRLQQRDSATAAANAAAEQSEAEQNTDEIYSLLSQPSYTSEAADTTDTGTVSTAADLDTSGDTDSDGSAGTDILSTLLGDLSSSLSGTNEASLIIPTVNTQGSTALSSTSIPTSAGAALTTGTTSGTTTASTTTVSSPIVGTPARTTSGGTS